MLLFIDTKQDLASRLQGNTAKGSQILCAQCRHPVTRQAERMAVDGAHEHRRTNLAWYRFHFGCFRAAPGCATQGAPSLEHTWFAGYAWKIAVCASCLVHLGWRFERGPG
jgi:hypothetical protein